ncbi:MAG: LysM peptidoglycan-binding domain-containing protein [Microbacteriaceae bacterium]|nr:LysM peptidoglycan-binding domain-containing protein [Cryobacterium sp.]MCC6376670.1 LysM peptidoglycan-binding domain-containing protein [Microbacteriaceae bacterium]
MTAIQGLNGALPATRLRITRRGRFVLAVIAIAIAGSVAALSISNSAIATAGLTSDDFQYVTVQPGETLWQLAESIAPSADPRDVIADLVRLNGIEGSTIHPGQELAIPKAYSN